ncbi:transporter substrate-binding domain-containing protein [Gordonia sp. GN26]
MSHKALGRARRLASRRSSVTAAAALVCAVALTVSGCGGSSDKESALDELKSSGTVRIAVADALPVSGADAKPTGYVPEAAQLVFKKMGIGNVETVPMDFGAMIPSLQSGRVDAVAGGLTITPERCGAVSFSGPTMNFSLDDLVVRAGNPQNLRTFEDVAKAGLELGVVSGTLNGKLAESHGVPASKIKNFNDVATLLDAVKVGRIPVGTYDNTTLGYLLSKPAYSGLVIPDVSAEEAERRQTYSVAVAFAKDAGDLADAFTTAQTEVISEGGFGPIAEQWSLPASTVPGPYTATTEQLCSE